MEKFEMTPLEYKKKQLYDASMQLRTIKAMYDNVQSWLKSGEQLVAKFEQEVDELEKAQTLQNV